MSLDGKAAFQDADVAVGVGVDVNIDWSWAIATRTVVPGRKVFALKAFDDLFALVSAF